MSKKNAFIKKGVKLHNLKKKNYIQYLYQSKF